MKRKYVYSALGLPVVVVAGVLLLLPSHTRSMFISEFKHRYLAMFVDEPEQPLEGLRRQNPEEYGPPPGAEANEQAAPTGADTDPAAIFASRDEDGDGVLRGEEIGPGMRENIERIDANSDGAITLEEFRNAMQQGRESADAGHSTPADSASP